MFAMLMKTSVHIQVDPKPNKKMPSRKTLGGMDHFENLIKNYF